MAIKDKFLGVAGPSKRTAAPPDKLYHYTSSEYADSIAEHGLKPGASGKVFTTPD